VTAALSDARTSPFWESHQPLLAIETTMKQPKIIDKSMQIARLGEFLLWFCSE
jgi:hypothetical protein